MDKIGGNNPETQKRWRLHRWEMARLYKVCPRCLTPVSKYIECTTHREQSAKRNKERKQRNHMNMIKFSAEDLARGKVFEPGTYDFRVSKVYEKKAKKDSSMNTVVEFSCLDPNYEAAVVTAYFSEKAPGMILPLFTALGIVVNTDTTYDPANMVDEVVRLKITNKEFDGRIVNNISGYMPKS